MRIVAISASLLLAMIFAGFLGALHPAFDSFAHFRAHLCAITVVAGTVLTALWWWRGGIAMIALSLGAGATTVPSWWSDEVEIASGASFRVLHANLRFDNDDTDAALALLKSDAPDAFLLTEVSDMWKTKLAAELPEWPFQIICPGRGKVGGAGILSRRPFMPTNSPQCQMGGGLAIASVNFAGAPLTLVEVHFHWPWPSRQMADINAISTTLAMLPASTLMTGDFNAAPWSRAVGGVAQAGNLNVIKGLGGTWSPAGSKGIRRFGLPLDNVLYGNALSAISKPILLPGSDHIAISVAVARSGG